MLQVALCPAPVARGIVDHVGGNLFPTPNHIRSQPDLVTGAPHEGGFDEIVAEDFPAERRFAGQLGQVAEFRELAQPQDGVMAPVVAFTELPVGQPARQHRAVQVGPELDEARKQSFTTRGHRQRLDDSGFRVFVHEPGESHQRIAGHDAVGIEHDGVVVRTAPGTHEIRDVAGLAADVLLAAAIEDPPLPALALDQLLPGDFFSGADLGLARIGQDEQVEHRLLRLGLE
jgi:hypothetical protein